MCARLSKVLAACLHALELHPEMQASEQTGCRHAFPRPDREMPILCHETLSRGLSSTISYCVLTAVATDERDLATAEPLIIGTQQRADTEDDFQSKYRHSTPRDNACGQWAIQLPRRSTSQADGSCQAMPLIMCCVQLKQSFFHS